MATPLHNHTHASALDGLAKPDEIVARVKELGFDACAVTDHNVVAGHIEFYTTLSESGIKPILGIETYQTSGPRQTNKGFRTDPQTKDKADNFHLILLAMNNIGLRNLWAMNTEAHRSGFYHNARVDWDLLERFNEGIICTSACGSGLLAQSLANNPYAGDIEDLVMRYRNIFGERFYVELSTYSEDWTKGLNIQLADIARAYGIPMIYANDAHYAFPGQYELHETMLCMQYVEKKSQRTEPHHTPDLYIMDAEDVDRHLDYMAENVVAECLGNTDKIAKLCNVTLPTPRQRVPVFIPDKRYKTAKEMLFEEAIKGYDEKITKRGLDSDEYMSRFKSEMEVIYEAGLVDYFLIVRDYIDWAKNDGQLVGPGRGSVGGSLVAYLLGIHEIDPIKYNLIFERFYNAGRKGSMPDIDTDFPTWGRDRVKDYLQKKYGEEYVADIGTASTLQGRAAIQKLGTTLEIDYGDIMKISKLIEGAIESGQQPKWEDIWKKAGKDLKPYVTKYPQLFEWAEYLHKHIFTYGVHASGLLIGDEPLDDTFPLRWHPKDQKLVTQWDMRTAEKLGFMKMDLLGVRTLDTLMEYMKLTNTTPQFFYDALLEEDQQPEGLWKLLDDGYTTGIFQIEDGGDAKSLCRQIKPRNLEDLALITALNRPGVLKAGAHVRYIDGRNGNPHPPIHPLIGEVTDKERTYGEIIYQEQLIEFFEKLGYDKKEADNIRKVTGKKLRDEMAKLKEDYETRFRAKGADEQQVERVWQIIEGFADYAFNKAHSIAYGAISYWTTYAKWHNPTAFLLGGMRSLTKEGKKDQIPRYVREAKRMKIAILPPDLNESDIVTKIDGDAIRYGFADVKGIGMTAAKWLVNNRPFADYEDVFEKSQEDSRKITLKNGTRKVGITRGHIGALKRLTDTEGTERAEAEEELLGVVLSDDAMSILDQYEDEIAKECTPIENIDKPGTYTIAGVIANIKPAKTKQGTAMAWVTIENNGVQREIAVWSSELQRLDFIWRRRQAVFAHVKVTDRGMSIIGAKALHSKES